jgi:hypothetical protein
MNSNILTLKLILSRSLITEELQQVVHYDRDLIEISKARFLDRYDRKSSESYLKEL